MTLNHFWAHIVAHYRLLLCIGIANCLSVRNKDEKRHFFKLKATQLTQICTNLTNGGYLCAALRSGLLAHLAIASHVKRICDISLSLPPYIRTLQTTSQSTKTSYPHFLKMADARDTAAPKVESIVNSPPLPTASDIWTASDICRQITANALVLYPNIVQNHITKFSNIPVRAQDIFDVCVANVTGQYGSEDASEDASKYIAKLTHAHMEYPAVRMLLLSGRAMPTTKLALHDFLERCAKPLGTSLDTLLPVREGCAEDTDGPNAGYAMHIESAIMGSQYAEEVRQMAMDFDMGKEPTPLSGSDE